MEGGMNVTSNNRDVTRMRRRHDNHTHASARGKKFVFVIFFNTIITVAEYLGGLFSGSLALISDAGHNLSDVLALMLGYAGERVSGKEPDKQFSFGLKRFEVVVALVNALSLLGIGIYIVYEAAVRYMHPVPIDIGVMIPVGAIGFGGNLFSMLFLMKERHVNLNMRAAFLHLFYDTVASVAVIVAGVILYYTGMLVIDLLVSILIVVMIIGSSISVIRESMRIFLQGTPLHINADEVFNDIVGMEHVGSVHGLHIWSVNSSEVFLSCHICVETEGEEVDTDAIIRSVNSMLAERYGISHTTLQVENVKICTGPGPCCR
jgi:cobalt-zinc-cadmium efflux system protein